jgi:hypothetical protein
MSDIKLRVKENTGSDYTEDLSSTSGSQLQTVVDLIAHKKVVQQKYYREHPIVVVGMVLTGVAIVAIVVYMIWRMDFLTKTKKRRLM